MFTKRNQFVLIPVIIIAVLAILFIVQPVFAEGETPADPIVATETPVPTDLPGTEAESEVAPPPADSGTVPAETAATEEPPAVAETTDPLPETLPTDSVDTAVVEDSLAALEASGVELVAADGETVITHDAGTQPIDGDPYFTVGAITYYFKKPGLCGGASYCFESSTPISAAVTYMIDHALTPSDRKLYVTADTYNEGVYLDGDAAGISGLTGLIGDAAESTDVQINGWIYVYNYNAGFTIKNLTVTNDNYSQDAAIWAWDNVGTISLIDVNAQATQSDSAGIYIEAQTGGVVLNRVNASDNAYQGVSIEAAGPVTVINSTIERNFKNTVSYDDFIALDITVTSGSYPVLLNGVTVQDNTSDGADIYAPLSLVTVKNSLFNFNDPSGVIEYYGDGLWIVGNTLTLENVYASDNDMRGIYAEAKAAFTGARLFTSSNGGTGLMVNTCNEWGDGICHNTGAGTVVVRGSPSIGNGGDGYNIVAKGAVTMYDIFTAGNGGDGAYIENDITTAPVTLTMLNMTGNYRGLVVYTRGTLLATNISCTGSTNDGIYIEDSGTGAVTFTINPTDPLNFNETGNNGGNGFVILAMGPVSLTSFDTYENSGSGAIIDNSHAASAMPVTYKVLDANVSRTGAWENGGGIEIYSRGVVTLNYVQSTNNQGFGLFINNMPPTTGVGPAVNISNGGFNDNCYHDEFGCYWSGDASQYGLVVISRGTITLLNVNANANYGLGAYLDNQYAGAAGNVVINAGTGVYNSFSGNGDEGLLIFSNKAITLTNIQAKYNAYNGAELFNNVLGSTSPITINAGSGMSNAFIGNGNGDGLYLYSNGAVTITNVNANWNASAGIYIDNTGGSGAVMIKQVGTWNYDEEGYSGGNTFSGNSSYGLYVISKGAVTVSFWHVHDNGSDGIYVETSSTTGAITISGVATDYGDNLSWNGWNGITVYGKGNITLNNINARRNDHDGVYLNNTNGLGSVTVNNGYFDENNYGYSYDYDCGLCILSRGAVVWKNGSAYNNGYYGATIINGDPGVAGKPVTITNVATCGNGETGLSIYSKGAVVLTNVESNNNSATHYYIGMDSEWYDNMSPDQQWDFNAPGSGSVTINVGSGNFTPSVAIFDDEWNFIAGADGAGDSGYVSLYAAGLTSGEPYHIRVYTDQWEGMSYSINIFEGETPPVSFNYYTSNAYGIYIDNHNGLNTGVTFNNTYHPWNSNNSGDDVYIISSGTVTLTNMELNDSGGTGLYVDNVASTVPAAITITKVSFYNNSGAGAWLLSNGAVTIKEGEASGNRGDDIGRGLNIVNNFSSALSPVTLVNFNMDGNRRDGAVIYSRGLVTFTNVRSTNNGGDGINITTLGAVTFTGTRGSGNGEVGASISTNGALTLNSLNGMYNNFNTNLEGGLYAEVGGRVTINKSRFVANGTWDEYGPTNEAFGLLLDVSNSLGTSPVVITDAYANGNTAAGADINTGGAVTLTKFTGNYNNYDGVYINQTTSPSSLFPITFNRLDVEGNGQSGAYVVAKGNIVVNKFVANNNGGNGLFLNNTNGLGTVTITNPAGGYTSNLAGMNGMAGVGILSKGVVNLTGIEAFNNGQEGVYVDNTYSLVTPAVIMNGTLARENNYSGIVVDSNGAVTINNSWSIGNHQDGIVVETPANTLIFNTVAINNDWAGIYANLMPSGNLTLNNSFWFGNLRNPNPGDANLMFYGGTLFIL